jgi:glycosyltransferase involved in cell wall biosynthesis
MRPLVSICIPTFSRPAELEEAIRSVLAQRYPRFEVVVSDNGTQGEAVVRRLADPRVRYFQNGTNRGLPANLNLSMDRARGDLIGLLMDDDLLLDDFIDRVVNRFESDASLDFVFTNHLIERGGRRRVRRCALAGGKYASFLVPALRHQPVAMSAALMRRRVWQAARPFPDLWTLDAAFYLRVAQAGFVFHYLDEPLMCYRVHAGQMSSDGQRFREDLVKLYDSLHFDDPECERIRRAHLARSLASMAASRLKHGRYPEAREAAMRARRTAFSALSTRQRAVVMLAGSAVLARLARQAWTALHPRAAVVP